MSDLATLRIVVDANGAIRAVDQFGNATEGAAKRTDELEKAAKRAGAVIGTTLVAGLALAVKETADAQREQAQLAAALRSTAGASGQTLDSLNAQTDALRKLTAATGGEIAEAQALLLTFTKIAGDTFPRATQVTLDMAQALGTDARSAALQLGKALNDPVLGATALSRAGVQFTETQKDVIKSFVETNQLAKAQALILAELETQVGGSAAAYRNTLGGALTAVKESFLELLELGNGPRMQGFIENVNILADAMGIFATQSALAFARSDAAIRRNDLRIGGFLSGLTGGAVGTGIAGTAGADLARIEADIVALEALLADQRAGVLAGINGRLRGRTGAPLGGGAGATTGAGVAAGTPFDIDNAEFAQVVGDAFRLLDAERELAKLRLNAQARQAMLTGEFAEQIGEGERDVINFGKAVAAADDGVSTLAESTRVFTEQTQLALGRFASDFLKDGFASLDAFWDDFLQLGRDAIGNVFAKSVMDRLGTDLGGRLAGLLGNVGVAGGGIIGVVGAGIAAGLGNIFGESKWERAAEENRRAARAMAEAAEELKASTFASRERFLDDFLNYANRESPTQRELRNLTGRRNELARDAFGIATTAGGSLSNQVTALLNRGEFGGNIADLIRRDAESINQTDLGRQALLDFADALEMLNAALLDNIGAASDAARAQQELTLAQFADELGGDATGRLSASQQFAEAQRQYAAMLALAQGGDASAIDSLPETARRLIDTARETFASGVRFQEVFGQVQGDIDALLADVRARTPSGFEGADSVTPPGFLTPGNEGADPNPPPEWFTTTPDWWSETPTWWEGPMTETAVPATVGFDYSIGPSPDGTVVAESLKLQTDRTLAVANAQLAVQQEGFLAVQKAVQNGLAMVQVQLAAIEWAIRNGTVPGVEPATVPFDFSRAS